MDAHRFILRAADGCAGRRNALSSRRYNAGRRDVRLMRFEPQRIQRARMTDDRPKQDGKAGPHVKDSRRDRLKLALRENLKRRKSQARGRDDLAASSEDGDASLDDAGGEKPGQ